MTFLEIFPINRYGSTKIQNYNLKLFDIVFAAWNNNSDEIIEADIQVWLYKNGTGFFFCRQIMIRLWSHQSQTVQNLVTWHPSSLVLSLCRWRRRLLARGLHSKWTLHVYSFEKILNVQIEQLEKFTTEMYALLKEGYGDECLSRPQVFECIPKNLTIEQKECSFMLQLYKSFTRTQNFYRLWWILFFYVRSTNINATARMSKSKFKTISIVNMLSKNNLEHSQ